MSILPKHHSQFKEKDYWDSFFAKLRSNKQEHFEWYGSFSDFRTPLFLILSQLYNLNGKVKTIRVAHLGCGTSTFGEDIAKGYPVFDLHVWNADYSEQTVARMEARRKQINPHPNVSYQVADLLKPVSKDLQGKFDLVVDKGTLDAMLPEDSQQGAKSVKEGYFTNVLALMRQNAHASFIVVSMLQGFVLKTLLQFFLKEQCGITINEAIIPDSQMQPFLVQIRRGPQPLSNNPISFKLLNKSSYQCSSIEEALEKVRSIQQLDSYTRGIRQLRSGQLAHFNVLGPNQAVRYMIDVLDSTQKLILAKNSCSVFIIPQGREGTSAFATEGLRSLQEQIGCSRLVAVKLVIGQKYTSLEEIKAELNAVLPDFIQRDCNPNQVPYLTEGSIGQRQYLYEDQALFVQEVLIQGEGFRRLVLRNNPGIVQSQFKLTYVAESANPHLKALQCGTLPPKKGMIAAIDPHYLDDSYCRAIVGALTGLLGQKLTKSRLLHLGGGSCVIPKFLYQYYPGIRQIIVEKCASVVKNSAKYFEWPEQGFKVELADAADFVESYEGEQYDAVIIDIIGEESESLYPPPQFSSPEFLGKVCKMIANGGVIVLNTLRLNEQIEQPKYSQILHNLPKVSLVYQSAYGGNTILAAVCSELPIVEQPTGPTVCVSQRIKEGKSVWEWEAQIQGSFSLAQPIVGQTYKQSQIQVVDQTEQVQKKKKKKK